MTGKYHNALVTGAAGFLGSFLVEELLRRGYEVMGIDNFFRGRKENLEALKPNPRFKFHKIDLTAPADLQQLRELIMHEGVDIVFHYAAINGTKYFYERPLEVLRVNTEATINLLNALAAAPMLRKIVYASSSEVYGEPLRIPIPETHPITLRSYSDRDSYAAGKAIGEFYVRLFSKQRGIAYLILRIFNTYGERMDTSEYGQVIPEFMRKILCDVDFTIIGDGTQTRSFCYVTDNTRMSLSSVEKVDNEILNVGSSEEVKIVDLAAILHELAGKPFKPKFLPPTPDDHRRRCPDISKITELTGEYPEVSLVEGLQQTFGYYQSALGKA